MNKIDWKSKFNKANQAVNTPRCPEPFVTSEGGTMTVLALFLMLVVFMAAGFAVDVMRYDRERAKLQYALDRAVLAAADLDQDLCPKAVVKDYLSKEGLDKYLVGDPVVEPDICGSDSVVLNGYRKVEATAEMDIEMHFMKWRGIETIASTAKSVAEESIGNVEISLVLDISGSMRGTKLTNLKKAAQEFVTEMANKSKDGKLSISIVPYYHQVSMPGELMDEINALGSNQVANCLEFPGDDFSTTVFPYYDSADADGNIIPGPSIPRTLHSNSYDYSDYRPANGLVDSFHKCRPNVDQVLDADGNEVSPGEQREIIVMQKDAVAINKRIETLVADGRTAIDLGLKWGLTLLDDSFQPVIAELVEKGHVPTEFSGRPARNNGSDTMKVLVLMTDGRNTNQYKINAPYNDGLSNIWWNELQEVYSFHDPVEGNFIWPDEPLTEEHQNPEKEWVWAREKRQDHAYGKKNNYKQYRCNEVTDGECTAFQYGKSRGKPEREGAKNLTNELTWPEVWERTGGEKIEEMLEEAYGYSVANDFDQDSTSVIYGSTKNQRVEDLCAEAIEKKHVVMFSIAFSAPSDVKPLLQNCVSAHGGYYEADHNSIVSVFASIGSTIQNLRLTQ